MGDDGSTAMTATGYPDDQYAKQGWDILDRDFSLGKLGGKFDPAWLDARVVPTEDAMQIRARLLAISLLAACSMARPKSPSSVASQRTWGNCSRSGSTSASWSAL